MCWLLMFSTALLCSGIAQARSTINHETGTETQEDKGMRIQKELEEAMKELELAEQLAEKEDTRESRGLLKKVAFLAGIRVGGLVQSSGTLAASNSLRVFGKVVNSALSVSYGTTDELNDIPGIETGAPVFAERPILEPASTKVISLEEQPIPVPVTQSVRETEEEAHKRIKAHFLKSHNELVERANANSKFLRRSRAQDLDKPVESR